MGRGSWKSKKLSPGDRERLIRVAIDAIPAHTAYQAAEQVMKAAESIGAPIGMGISRRVATAILEAARARLREDLRIAEPDLGSHVLHELRQLYMDAKTKAATETKAAHKYMAIQHATLETMLELVPKESANDNAITPGEIVFQVVGSGPAVDGGADGSPG